MDEVLPWETASRDGVYGGTRRRQDSAADSGSSSSDLSTAVAVTGERRRLPQQSTLDGGLRGAPPPLRRLSAVEPRHLAPLSSPPNSPRPPRPAPAPVPVPHPHPTPTISVSSAPDDDSPAGTGSPEIRSLAHSDEPSSVFASADATPTEPREPTPIADAAAPGPAPTLSASPVHAPAPAQTIDKTVLPPSCDSCRSEVSKVEVRKESAGKPGGASPAVVVRSDSRDSKRPKSPVDDVDLVRRTLSREPSTIKEISPASSKDSCKIADLPISGPKRGGPSEMAPTMKPPTAANISNAPSTGRASPTSAAETSIATGSTASSVASTSAVTPALSSANIKVEPGRPPVAPLADWEDTGVDDDNVDKVPSAPVQRVSGDSKAASESDATKQIAHKDELSSVSESNIVKRDNKSELEERKKRNDICPWEDE